MMAENIFETVLELFGKEKQIYVAVEELAELQKELLKNVNRGEDNRVRILAEMADVLITLEYLKLCYKFTETEIAGAINHKLERLRSRIAKEFDVEQYDCRDCVYKGTEVCEKCVTTKSPSGKVSRPTSYLTEEEFRNNMSALKKILMKYY